MNKRVLIVANVAKEHLLKFHVPTIRRLKESGWYVDVACSGVEEVPYCDHQYRMSYKRSPFNFALLKGIRELKEIVQKGGYDIIYCHTPVGGLAGRIASINERKKGTKVIYCAHGYHFFKGAPKKNWLIYYPIEKIMSLVTDSIILINKEDYELTKKRFQNCRAYLINGIGVDASRFKTIDKESIRMSYRKEMGIPDDATVLIYLAELLQNKNQTFLMSALKRVLAEKANVYLLLAGFDHSDGLFEKYAEEIGVKEKVRFLGWREDVGNLYAMADICTATSIREGFGINLVEAMLCEIPVIATKNRGHETIIRDGENGFLVTLGDEELYSKRILQLIEDHDLKKKFVDNANKEKERYLSNTIVTEIEKILEEHLEKRML